MTTTGWPARKRPSVDDRDRAGEVDAADERELAQDLAGRRPGERVLVVHAGVGDVDDDVAWRELVDRRVDEAARTLVVGDPEGAERHRASGSGRSWNCITLLVVPLPVSMWNGARVLIVAQRPRPFQPPFGSSMRPSIHFV